MRHLLGSLLAVALAAGISAPADAKVTRYLTGNAADVDPALFGPVLNLGGGGTDVDQAIEWMIDQARGCTAASRTDRYWAKYVRPSRLNSTMSSAVAFSRLRIHTIAVTATIDRPGGRAAGSSRAAIPPLRWLRGVVTPLRAPLYAVRVVVAASVVMERRSPPVYVAGSTAGSALFGAVLIAGAVGYVYSLGAW
jgi:hypothetical protein